jgi:hypothetical protein
VVAINAGLYRESGQERRRLVNVLSTELMLPAIA